MLRYLISSPPDSAFILAQKYGSPAPARAPRTARTLAASRLKKYTPGFSGSCGARTYVRTFNSGNVDAVGIGGAARNRTPLIQNGITPIQALPSNVSSMSSRGTSGRIFSGGNAQCAKSRSCHLWTITHGSFGSDHGRWAVWERTSGSDDRVIGPSGDRAKPTTRVF